MERGTGRSREPWWEFRMKELKRMEGGEDHGVIVTVGLSVERSLGVLEGGLRCIV